MPYGFYQRVPEWGSEAVTRCGVVTRQPTVYPRYVRATVRLLGPESHCGLVQLTLARDTAERDTTTRDTAVHDIAAHGIAHSAAACAAEELHPGDEIAFHTLLTEPRNLGNPGERDWATYNRHQGITGTAYVFRSDWRRLGPTAAPRLRERMLLLRERLVSAYAHHFDGDTFALLAAMTLGDRSYVDSELRERYSRTGSSHIMALSGMHLSVLVAILVLTLMPLTRRYGASVRWLTVGVTLIVVWTFALLAGLPVSLVRAALMLSLVSLFSLREVNVGHYHPLILALIVMLVVDPGLLYDIGLQLSALSVAAIITVGRMRHMLRPNATDYSALQLRLYPLADRLRQSRAVAKCPRLLAAVLRWIGALLVVSIAAQVVTLPLVAHTFGRIAWVGPLASLFVIPAATIVLVGAWSFLLLIPLRGMLAAALTWVVGMLHSLLDALGALPGAAIAVQLSTAGMIGCYMLMGLVGWSFALRANPKLRGRRATARHFNRVPTYAVLLIGLTLLVSVETCIHYVQRPATQLAVYNRAGHMEVHLTTPTTDSVVTAMADDGRYVVGRVVDFGGRRLAVADRWMAPRRPSDAQNASSFTRLPVDALLVTRGMKGRLANYLSYYAPTTVVLDASLHMTARNRYAAEAAEANLPVYDVRERGAFILCANDLKP